LIEPLSNSKQNKKRRSAKAGLFLEGKLMEQQDNDRQKIDNSRLARAKRKLERLKRDYSAQISRVFDHQAQTNGQPSWSIK